MSTNQNFPEWKEENFPVIRPIYEAIRGAVVGAVPNTGTGNTGGTSPTPTPTPSDPATGGSGSNGGSTGNTGGSTQNPPKGTGEEVPQPSQLPFNTVILKVEGRYLTVRSNSLIQQDKVIMRLATQQGVNVVGVRLDKSDTDGDLTIVTIDQDIADPSKVVGFPAIVADRYKKDDNPAPVPSTPSTGNSGGTPATGGNGNAGSATPAPSTGGSTTAPSTGSGNTTQFTEAEVNDYSGGDWVNGTWQASDKAGISLKGTPEAIAAYVVGAEVTFSDGSKRTITFAQPDANLNVWFDGGKLDPKVGYPNKVKAPKRAVTQTPSTGGNQAPSSGSASGVVGNLVEATFEAISWFKGYLGQIFMNLGMGAGGDSVLPGIHGRNYAFASEAELRRAYAYGIRRIRAGFLWERAVKPGGKSELYRGDNETIDQMIVLGRLCKKIGITVKWDMHNYGGYSNTNSSSGRKKVGSNGGPSIDVYANDWKAIILALKSDKDCWDATYGFDTMNEWESMTYAVVKAAGQKVLDVCAQVAEKKMFIFEGINYSSCTNWVQNNPDYYTLKHPLGKEYIEFSAHLYLDAGADGYYTEGDIVSAGDAAKGWTQATVGLKRIEGFANWCKQYGVKGNIGENIVTGSMSKLMLGETALLKFCVASGIDVYIFGMGDWFGNNAHNIELEVNKPMLALVKSLNKAA